MNQEVIRINLNGVNCYLGKMKEGFVLFDTGGNLTLDKEFNNRRQELVQKLEQEGCYPGDLKAIILTHGDIDHTMNAAYLREQYQTIIAMHKGDIDLVENLTIDKMLQSFQFKSPVLKLVFKLMKKTIRKISEKSLNTFEAFRPDALLKEGDSLAQYGFEGEVIHLPGHTVGSIGILCENGELIAGDTFTNMKKPATAINAYSFKELRKSVKKLKEKKITRIYPGHGEPFQANLHGF